MKIKVGVIFGGETVEHEVSVISAVQAMNHMNTEKYDIVPIYISKDKNWYTGKMLMEIDKYKASEDGITNIKNNSTVKFKDNGDIDIFVDNNTGIRISPNSKSIELYGTFKINGKVVGN